MQKTKEAHYKLEFEDWCSSYLLVPESEMSLGRVFNVFKKDGWNGNKGNYRLTQLEDGNYLLETNLDCGNPCEWREAQIIKRVVHHE